jgi:FkbM family methyltransferase
MVKKLSYICFKVLVFLDTIFKTLTKRSVLIYFNDFIQDSAYKSIKILDKEIKFFIPNQLLNWRVDTFFTKEPETLEWIDNFEKKENLTFWDIGANIGLYSIYNSLKNPKSTTIAFDPSSSNLRVLTRNISINNLEKNIKVVSMPLTNKKTIFQEMKEGQFIEGGAMNSFGEKFDFEGKEFRTTMKYNLLGTTMNYFIENSILEIPDYIKIDVDGIEHLILEGGDKFLTNQKVKSLLIEINENFKEQYEQVLDLMEKNKFRILHKKFNDDFQLEGSKFNKTFNYVFIKKNYNFET